MFDNIFSFKIGGQAGMGIKSIGLFFAKVATRSGHNVYGYSEYPSLIRGGHNVMQVCVSKEEVTAPIKRTDFLIALNQDTINRHFHELVSGGGILYDEHKKIDTAQVAEGVHFYP